MLRKSLFAAAVVAVAVSSANAALVITEIARGGSAGEFIEITNIGSTPYDLAGHGFNDNNLGTGPFDISSLGVLAPGESAIISELPAADFRTAWNLAPTVKVIGGNDQNLGNGDDTAIYNGATLVTIQTYPGGQAVVDGETWTTAPSNYGINNFALWTRSVVGDYQNSFLNAANTYAGSPGVAVVPEPAAATLLALPVLAALRRRR